MDSIRTENYGFYIMGILTLSVVEISSSIFYVFLPQIDFDIFLFMAKIVHLKFQKVCLQAVA